MGRGKDFKPRKKKYNHIDDLLDTYVPERITDTCWIWIGHQNDHGYGRGNFNGRQTQAHRLIYEVLVGDVPLGLELDHLCRNRLCVNPAHMEPVTHQENVRRAKFKTHCVRGHLLTDEHLRIRPQRRSRDCFECARIRARAYAERMSKDPKWCAKELERKRIYRLLKAKAD